MASPTFERGKIKTVGKLAGWLSHDGRLTNQHKNKHIDAKRTKLNFSYKGRKKAEVVALVEKRLSECTNYDPQKQREENNRSKVILQSVVLYPPDGLSDVEAEIWFKRVGIPATVEIFGEDRIAEIYVHFDEVHTYIDCFDGEEKPSKVHAHVLIMPTEEKDKQRPVYHKDNRGRKKIVMDEVLDEQGQPVLTKSGKPKKKKRMEYVVDENGNRVKEYKLNAKKICGTVKIKKYNQALERLTKKEMGIAYHTGKGKRQAVDVETLKLRSLELMEKQEGEMQQQISSLLQQIDSLKKEAGKFTPEELQKLRAILTKKEDKDSGKGDQLLDLLYMHKSKKIKNAPLLADVEEELKAEMPKESHLMLHALCQQLYIEAKQRAEREEEINRVKESGLDIDGLEKLEEWQRESGSITPKA